MARNSFGQWQGIYFYARARTRIYSSIVALVISLFVFSRPSFAATLTFAQASADLKTSDLSRRYAAAVAMKNFGANGAVQALTVVVVYEKNLDVQAAMLQSLASLRDTSAIPAIASLLSNRNAFVRQRAAQTISLLGGSQAEKVLTAALATETDTYVRTTEIQGLSVCGSAHSVPALQAALNDSKPEVRVQAIEALKNIPGTEATQALKGHKDTDPKLRKRVDDAVKTQQNGAK